MSEKSERETKKNNRLQQLISYGMPLLGAGASAAVSSTLGLIGPEGAAIGGMVGKGVEIWLSNVGQEISERHLGTREKVRVGAAFAIATAEIQRRLENGESRRNDGFFDEKQSGRSDAEEVAEHVLLKAQREPEEKKIQYMGYLLSNIAFNSEISVHMAHQLTKIAEQLTYRQLCILKFCTVKNKFSLRDENYRNQQTVSIHLRQLLYECADLHSREYIHVTDDVLLGVTNIKPSGMTLQGLGGDLYKFMQLALIPEEDIAPIAEQLK